MINDSVDDLLNLWEKIHKIIRGKDKIGMSKKEILDYN